MRTWSKDIRKVSSLDHDPTTGSALQEINFWLSVERSLTHIKDQISRPEVEVTLQILNQAKRIQVVFVFKNDTDLDKALTKAQGYNNLMRDFPINDLLSATDLESLAVAIEKNFTQMKKIRQTDSYPFQRAIHLVEALSRDLTTQTLKILSNVNILYLEWRDFKELHKKAQNVFAKWDENLKNFREMIRTIFTRRANPPGAKF